MFRRNLKPLRLRSRQSAPIVTSSLTVQVAISSAIVLALVYMLWQLSILFSSPPLEISHPVNNQVLASDYVEVVGSTSSSSQVLIEGQEVLVDSEGNFTYNLVLPVGINTISVVAQSRLGRTSSVELVVIVEGT